MNRSTSSLLIIPVVAFLMGNQGARAGNILGFAVDSTSGAPIHGVTVSAKDAGTSSDWVRAATDQDGHFELTGLGEGQYTVVFSHVGFVTKVVDSCRVSGTAISGALVAELVPAVINVNAISVTASRRPEKVVEAPASVAVLDSTCIQSKTTLSTAEHLKTLPAVDAVATGINSSSVVVRGFNNVFSTTLLSMIDNRLTHVPSLRVNAYQFVPIVNEDVDRIELVLGPGSALYGPNCTDGVMHIVTKSPFASSGTLVSVAGGERDFAFGSFRTSGRISENLAARLSGQYYQAEDWKVFDPAEPDSVILFRQTPDGNRYEAAAIDNARDFETEKISFDGRLDWAVSDEAMIITNAGFNRASNIELTDLGAAQAVDWSYGYGQVRFTYKDLFVQGFVNMSDAGDTYLRRSGAMIIDNSRFWVGQIQHAFRLGRRQSFTYGLDAYFTRPSTEGTLNGRNEDRDNINEYGVYLQSESRLTPWMKFVVAGRLDDHSLVEKPIFSPRAALAFQPAPSHNFRITYNRAYSTPGTPNFFLDILSASVPTDDPVLESIIGPTIMNVRGMGAGDGFTFSYSEDGRPEMVSLYGDMLAEMGSVSAPEAYLPADVNSVWPAIRQLAVAGDPALENILPAALSEQVPGQFAVLDPVAGMHRPVDPSSVTDVGRLTERRTTNLEVGYKGLLFGRLAAGIDVYYTRMHNFIGPLMVETPHVFIDSAAFVDILTDDIVATSGGALDSATAEAVAGSIYDEFRELPIGLVSPEELQNPTDVVMTYRNFGEVDLFGVDLSLTYHFNEHWNISGNYSYISKNMFRDLDGVTDLAVNAPRHKFGGCVQYLSSRLGLDTRLNFRWVDGFPMNSGVYIGEVKRYAVFDLNIAYDLTSSTRVALTVQNLFDNRHAEFVGAPEMGRLAILRVTQSF